MPPRYAYWTILIDGKATAFRAREREELLPTFNQLARKNADIVMRYFARGKLWDSPEQAEWANRNPQAPRERRGADWRPGGAHKDPRARFEQQREKKNRPPRERDFNKAPKPWERPRPAEDGSERKWNKPAGEGSPRKWNKPPKDGPARKWNKPAGDGSPRKWNKPSDGAAPRKWNKPAEGGFARKPFDPAKRGFSRERSETGAPRKPWSPDSRPPDESGTRAPSDRPRWPRPQRPHPPRKDGRNRR